MHMSCDPQLLVAALSASPGDKLCAGCSSGLTTSREHLPARPSSSSLRSSALCAALLFRSWHCSLEPVGRSFTAITVGKSLKTSIAAGFDASLVATPERPVFAQRALAGWQWNPAFNASSAGASAACHRTSADAWLGADACAVRRPRASTALTPLSAEAAPASASGELAPPPSSNAAAAAAAVFASTMRRLVLRDLVQGGGAGGGGRGPPPPADFAFPSVGRRELPPKTFALGYSLRALWWAGQLAVQALSDAGPCTIEAVQRLEVRTLAPGPIDKAERGGTVDRSRGLASFSPPPSPSSPSSPSSGLAIAMHIRRGDACMRYTDRFADNDMHHGTWVGLQHCARTATYADLHTTYIA